MPTSAENSDDDVSSVSLGGMAASLLQATPPRLNPTVQRSAAQRSATQRSAAQRSRSAFISCTRLVAAPLWGLLMGYVEGT